MKIYTNASALVAWFRHARNSRAGTWDFVHVAAQHVDSEIFITCDGAQAELASIGGLARIHLFK